MNTENNFLDFGKVYFFGFFKGSPLVENKSENEIDNFNEYKNYKNKIPKNKIIKHIESLDFFSLCGIHTYDIFTRKKIENAGEYKDGNFIFPIEFLHYLKNYDIGVPYEYEAYLQSIGIDK